MKRYEIENDDLCWSAIIEIDETVLNSELIKESLCFFSGGERLYNDCIEDGGNLYDVYVNFIAGTICDYSFKNGGWETTIIREWESMAEGYPSLDGKMGLRLVSVDHPEVYDFEFSVKEIV